MKRVKAQIEKMIALVSKRERLRNRKVEYILMKVTQMLAQIDESIRAETKTTNLKRRSDGK